MLLNNTPTQQQPQNQQDYNQPPVGRTTTGTGFANIDQIVNANQGAGQKMGNVIGKGINDLGNSVNQAANTGYSAFNTQAQSALNPYYGTNGYYTQANQLTQQPGEDSATYYSRIANMNSGDLSKLGQNVTGAKYTGPTGIANAQNLQAQGQNVGNIQSLGSTPAGQQQLLSSYIGGRNYTQGESALDQALLGQGGQAQVQKGIQNLSGIPQRINDLINNAQTQAQSYQTGLPAQGGQISTAVNQVLNSPATTGTNPNAGGILTQATAAGTAAGGEIGELQKILSGQIARGNYTQQDVDIMNNLPAVLAKYGLNQNVAQGINLNTYNPDNTNAERTAILNNISSGLVAPAGGYLFSNPNQAATAANLSSFLGNTNPGTGIDASKLFNQEGVNTEAAKSIQTAGNAQNVLTSGQAEAQARYNDWVNTHNGWGGLAVGGPENGYVDPVTGYTISPGSRSVDDYTKQLQNDINSYNSPLGQLNHSGITLDQLLGNTFGNNNTLANLNAPIAPPKNTMGPQQNPARPTPTPAPGLTYDFGNGGWNYG